MDLVFSSAARLAAAIRTGQVAAQDVVEAHLAQIATYNPALNAVVTLDAERAREQARRADEALRRGQASGPLHGVPFTLKDALATAGVRTTTGFPAFAKLVPEHDGTVAARLKAAGGILLGKTNVAEMLADFQTSNPIFGRTNNPWNPARTPGGSSGGAAAAVASGMTPFEIGTDMSGSIRVPAHFCGLFALKPTETRISLDGVIPGLTSPRSVRIVSCLGPMARTVEDLALIYSIIAGPDRLDTEVKPVPIDPLPALRLSDLRIGFAPTFPGLPVAAAVGQAIETLARDLGRAGAQVTAASLPRLDFSRELANVGELIGMLVGAFAPVPGRPAVTLANYFEALHRRDQSIIAWEQFFDDCDVLLCPAAPVTAFPHGPTGAPLRIDGQEMSYWMVSAHSALFNHSGHPAVVLPYRRDPDGLPIGVQLVGKRWDESRLLAMAQAIAQVTGDFQRPSGYPPVALLRPPG